MNWREKVAYEVIWLKDTGSNRATVSIDRVGPLFKVYETWYVPDIHEGWAQALNPTWHLTYNGAYDAFEKRVRNVRDASYVEDIELD